MQIRNTRLAAIFAAALFLLFHPSQTPVNAQKARPLTAAQLRAKYLITTLAKNDMQVLVNDAPPPVRKRLAENPDLRKTQAGALREMLAMAGEAVKTGIVDDRIISDLENIRIETAGQLYDQKINKDKSGKPFSAIAPARVKAFYAKPANRAQFGRFVKTRLEQAKKDGIIEADRVFSEKEMEEARDVFARARIYDAEARLNARKLGAAYNHKVNLKIRLQQAQYISGIYARTVLMPKVKVSDMEIQEYIAGHPELTSGQKAKALGILARARSGEDFAALADEFTEDPGNRGEGNTANGGLYKDVTLGKMVVPFERAALALEPGQVSPGLVETQFGYHIIKLDKKGPETDWKGKPTTIYDVRHILISTMIEDPRDPGARPVIVNDMVREKLETAKEKRAMEEILRNNPVSVAEDFEVGVT